MGVDSLSIITSRRVILNQIDYYYLGYFISTLAVTFSIRYVKSFSNTHL